MHYEYQIIAGLARAVPADIKRCAEALEPAPLKRIHIVLATSDIHLQYKMKITREECVKRAIEAIQLAKTLCGDVEFSPEDAGRSDEEFLSFILGKCIEAGATTINVPDTVGYNTPEEYGRRVKYLIDHTPGSDKVSMEIFGVCH
jgi:2-isopropylmalate synthase